MTVASSAWFMSSRLMPWSAPAHTHTFRPTVARVPEAWDAGSPSFRPCCPSCVCPCWDCACGWSFACSSAFAGLAFFASSVMLPFRWSGKPPEWGVECPLRGLSDCLGDRADSLHDDARPGRVFLVRHPDADHLADEH